LVGGTGRFVSTTVCVIQTLNATLFSVRASLECTSTVVVSFTDEVERWRRCADVSQVAVAEGLGSCLFSSPLVKWAVGVSGALYAATTFNLTVRGTWIRAVLISGTEVYADTREWIAVRVRCNCCWRTIRTSTAVVECSAIVTESIKSTVGGDSRAISIGLASNAGTSDLVTTRLFRDTNTVIGIAESIGCASNARSISVTVLVSPVSGKVALASSIVS